MRIDRITYANHIATAAMVARASDRDVMRSFMQALTASCSPSGDLADSVGLYLCRREMRSRGLLGRSTTSSTS